MKYKKILSGILLLFSISYFIGALFTIFSSNMPLPDNFIWGWFIFSFFAISIFSPILIGFLLEIKLKKCIIISIIFVTISFLLIYSMNVWVLYPKFDKTSSEDLKNYIKLTNIFSHNPTSKLFESLNYHCLRKSLMERQGVSCGNTTKYIFYYLVSTMVVFLSLFSGYKIKEKIKSEKEDQRNWQEKIKMRKK